MLLTKCKINRVGYKFLSIFAKNMQSKPVLVLVVVLESKGPLLSRERKLSRLTLSTLFQGRGRP